ncbi:hypothetical protein AMS68_000061 [Peltaster fructicola]|uniref:Beta-lactamase-related domain-containing protein n=1 Tax=Peltaster fructicola TaxID=286661 RepID=A0A6H0XIK6_9PEZI|nr:hypothetical protein AMS68_000061 [Peltaster fructicola]
MDGLPFRTRSEADHGTHTSAAAHSIMPSPIINYFNSSAFTSKIEILMQHWHVPALSIAITHGDDISARAFGYANLESAVPCTTDTIFDIADVSKSLTAGSVALLDIRGCPVMGNGVDWSSPVSKYLPDDFVMAKRSYTKDATVEDIMCHQSGLPGYASMGIASEDSDDSRSVTRKLRNLALAAPLRSKFIYGHLMYAVAAHLVETRTNSSFGDFLEKWFFRPLNMSSTYSQPDAVRSAGQQARMATPYRRCPRTGFFVPLQPLQRPEFQGAGSIFTTASDYILWVRAVMLQQPPITKLGYSCWLWPRSLQNPEDLLIQLHPQTSWSMYAPGWEIRFYRGVQIFKHDGSTLGFGSTHGFLPQYKFGTVILGTGDGAKDLANIVQHILIDEVLAVPDEQRPDWIKVYKEADAYDLEEAASLIGPEYRGYGSGEELQLLTLDAYTGEYWNAAYKTIRISVKDGGLFIDATDRSMPISIYLEHVWDQYCYSARIETFPGQCVDIVRSQFELQDDVAVAFGIHLAPDQDWNGCDEELVWFTRV